MQAVILAAGRGSRMGFLTDTVPKPMLQVKGKTLLEHKFDILPQDVSEVILVVGYLKEVIMSHFGDSYKGKKVSYVEQKNIIGGTADALYTAKDLLERRFIVMMGDDIYDARDISEALKYDWSLVVQTMEGRSVGGRVVFDEERHIVEIAEGVSETGGAISTNLFVLDPRLFDHPMVPKAPGSSEMGLPQTVLAASQASHIPVQVLEAHRWIQISDPDDMVRAELSLKD